VLLAYIWTQPSKDPVMPQRQTNRIRTVGIAFLIIGLLGIGLPAFFTIAFEQLVAWLLVLAGLSGLTFAWNIRADKGSASHALVAGLTLLLGLIFLFRPLTGTATLTWLLVTLFVLEGVASLVFGWISRNFRGNWIWMMISGAVSLLVAFLILEGWPATTTWVLGTLIGINFLSTGLSLVLLAAALRRGGQ